VSTPDWPPNLMELNQFGGNWDRYLAALYEIFCADFKFTRPEIAGMVVRAKYQPNYRGKEDGFWHLITQEEDWAKGDRLPNMRRCELIRWPRALIDAFESDRTVWWQNRRGRKQRLLIALPDFSYVVVLDYRRNHYLLWTQYPVEHRNRRNDLRKEYDAFWKDQGRNDRRRPFES